MKNKSIVDAWDRLGPDAVTENRVLSRIEEKQARRRRSLRWAMPAAVAAVLALAVLAGTVFTPDVGNTFTVQAYALEETADGSVVLRETDLYDQSAGTGGYYDGENLFISIGLKYDGNNIERVTFSTETGFLAAQHISDYDEPDRVSQTRVGPEEKLVMIGESFDILGPEVTFDGAMDEDLLLFWGVESPDGDYIPDSVELVATARFHNGETQTIPVSVPLKGEGVGPGVIAYAPDEHEATSYVTQVEYYASLPAEAWMLIEDSVLPVADGWYGYYWEEGHQDFMGEYDERTAFDETGDNVSFYPGFKVVIHRNDDGSLTGMVYHVAEEFMYGPEG